MTTTTTSERAPTAITFRPFRKTDGAYLATSWLKSFRGSDAVRGVDKSTYFYFHHKVLEELVARSRIVMAVERQDDDRLAGFAVFEDRLLPTCVLHYVFVRKRWRGQGIGTALVHEVLDACDPPPQHLAWTHRTRGAARWIDTLARARGLAPLYNPYLITEAA